MYDLTRKYRTIHSIVDADVDRIFRHIESLDRFQTFLDFGCHFCHLSLEVAMRYPVKVYAVDNFVGYGDPQMNESIQKITGRADTVNFFEKVVDIIDEYSIALKGVIHPIYVEDFEEMELEGLDFAYFDADHGQKERDAIIRTSSMLRSGGIIGGHDFEAAYAQDAISKIAPSFEPVESYVGTCGSWFMRKK